MEDSSTIDITLSQQEQEYMSELAAIETGGSLPDIVWVLMIDALARRIFDSDDLLAEVERQRDPDSMTNQERGKLWTELIRESLISRRHSSA